MVDPVLRRSGVPPSQLHRYGGLGSIDLAAVLEPLHFLLPHREPAETLPADTELTLSEEPAAVLGDSEKTERLEEVEKEEEEGEKEQKEHKELVEKEEEEEAGETAHEEFSLD